VGEYWGKHTADVEKKMAEFRKTCVTVPWWEFPLRALVLMLVGTLAVSFVVACFAIIVGICIHGI